MLLTILLTLPVRVQAATLPCRIEIVETDSGWPVPLVELLTTHQVRFVSDNAGIIAFDLPELMDRATWFDIQGHGYEVARDGFGYAGIRLTPRPGDTLRVEVRRSIIARRLGRLTGAGLFAESARFNPSDAGPESGVLGCDSVQTTLHDGRRFWLWGDTTLARYPLGVFHSTAAFTEAQPLVHYQPPLRLHFQPLTDTKGSPREVARMPGDGPTWLSACLSLPDASGQPRLVASYMKIRPPLEAYEWGLCVWNDRTSQFERHKILWTQSSDNPKPPPLPQGHAQLWQDPDGTSWALFGNPFPFLRCPASFEAWEQPATWEPLTPVTTLQAANNTGHIQVHSAAHSGSIAWHPWRQRWVAIVLQSLGKPSDFGELWYTEARHPTGPWGPAVKVLSHPNYTFYNPRLHADLTPTNAPILLFEGTFTAQFADRPQPVPRYDYNQILYRLDLDDPRLAPAQVP
jgi:hypothetical protein